MQPGPAGSEPGGTQEGIDAKRFIFWLFVVLAVATAAILLWFIDVSEQGLLRRAEHLEDTGTSENATEAEDLRSSLPGIRFRLHAALAGNLALPVAAWFVLKAIASPGRRLHWILVACWAGLATFAALLLLMVAAGRIP